MVDRWRPADCSYVSIVGKDFIVEVVAEAVFPEIRTLKKLKKADLASFAGAKSAGLRCLPENLKFEARSK